MAGWGFYLNPGSVPVGIKPPVDFIGCEFRELKQEPITWLCEFLLFQTEFHCVSFISFNWL